MDRLAEELGDPDVQRLFSVASALHVNFYEDWRSTQAVAAGLDDVERLLEMLDALASA